MLGWRSHDLSPPLGQLGEVHLRHTQRLGVSFGGIDMMDGECLCVLLYLVVQDQHKSATHASEHVGPGTLEESFGSLILGDLFPTVDCALVHNVSFWERKGMR